MAFQRKFRNKLINGKIDKECYIISKKLNKKEMIAYQLSERGGKIYCIDKNERVSIGGEAITFFRGEIEL